LIIEEEARPEHYLLPKQKAIPKGQTTADIYTDWDIDQLAETMRHVLAEDEE
jgi:hypothetical protein